MNRYRSPFFLPNSFDIMKLRYSEKIEEPLIISVPSGKTDRQVSYAPGRTKA